MHFDSLNSSGCPGDSGRINLQYIEAMLCFVAFAINCVLKMRG